MVKMNKKRIGTIFERKAYKLRKIKFKNGWQVWQVIDPVKKEITTRMKWYGRNFDPSKIKEMEE